jgi:hydrogenase maturation factor
VHVGFAISQVDEEDAARTLADLRQLGELAGLEE